MAKKGCPRLRELAPAASGGITQPRTTFLPNSVLLSLKCIFPSMRLRETRASGSRQPGGGIHATYQREICNAECARPEGEALPSDIRAEVIVA